MKPYDSDYIPTSEGLYPDIEESEYFRIKAVNQSYLKEITRSPMHYRYMVDHPRDSTDDMKVGTGFHWACLEPDRFDNEVVRDIAGDLRPNDKGKMKPLNRNSNEYRAWREMHQNVLVLPEARIKGIEAMVGAVHGKSAAVEFLGAGGWNEVTLLWRHPEYGFWCKARIDWIPAGVPGCLCDLKKSVDASFWGFIRHIKRFRYYWQAAWYLGGMRHLTGEDYRRFIWIVAEADPPYGVNVFEAGPEYIAEAEDSMDFYLKRLAECLDTGQWPGYDDEIVFLGHQRDTSFDNDYDDDIPF
jgi:hypothetical protein